MRRRSIVGLLVAMLVTALGGPASAEVVSATTTTDAVGALAPIVIDREVGPVIVCAPDAGEPCGLEDAVAITAGAGHSCALLNDGTARCWGRNDHGQLGDGTTTQRTTPVPVSGLSNVIAITAGFVHTCALLADGTAHCWGYNFNGQLGDGTTTSRTTPVPVSGLSDAVAITGGRLHTCALLADGTARCWGYNDHGQLGDGTTALPDGTTISRTTPVRAGSREAAVHRGHQ